MRTMYPSYHFVDHDPILDALATVIADSGVTKQYIENKSGVTTTTLRNYELRKTKRPQFATINAVVRCVGAEIVVRSGTREIVLGRKNRRRT